MKRAFTLIEVNLAMLIMAGGILSIVGLYSFGFRENNQSREDVASAALADKVMNPLIMALSYTNNQWSTFKDEWTFPQNGWEAYMSNYEVKSDPTGTAQGAFGSVMGKCRVSFSAPGVSDTGLSYALVVHHEKDSATASVALRAVQKNNYSTLMSQPVYFTEVVFQGVER